MTADQFTGPQGRGFGPAPSLAAAALALLAAPLAALGAGLLFAQGAGLHTPGAVFTADTLASRQALSTVVYFAALHAALLGTALVAARAFGGSAVTALGLGPPRGGAGGYAVATLVTLAGLALWLLLLTSLWPERVAAEIGDLPRLLRTGPGLLMFPVLALLAPVAEEVLFRGLVFGGLQKTRLGAVPAAVLSSLLWAGLHVDHTLFSQAQLFLAGLLLCWLVAQTQSLRVAIWCHILVNAALGVVLLSINLPQ